MIGVGLIGCGYWGPNILKVLLRQKGARVVRVADAKPGRREFVEREFPDVKVCSDYSDVIRDSAVDAVIVATPVTTHYEIGRAALESGKHVLVEKPLAYRAEQARAMANLAARLGKILMAGHIFQYAPAVVEMKRLCSRDSMREIYYIDAARMNMGPPQTEVDVIWDLGPHDVSIVCHLLGLEVLEVQATGSSYAWAGLTDMAFLTVRYPRGVQARVHLSWLSPYKVRRMHVAGSGGAILYDETEAVEKIRFFHQGVDTRIGAKDTDSGQLAYAQGRVTVPRLETWEPLEREMHHFMDCIESGREPLSGPRLAVRVVEILEAASRSIAEAGTPQSIA